MVDQQKKRKMIYWGIVIVTGLIVISVFALLAPVFQAVFSFILTLFAPFVVSSLIAYLLYPVIIKLSKWGFPRWLAILSIYLLFFGGAGYLIYQGYPMILTQLRDLNAQLPELMQKYSDFIYNVYDSTSFLPESVHDKIDRIINDLETYMDSLLSSVADVFMNVMDIIVFLTVIPVLVFYILKDYETIKSYGMKWLPVKARDNVQKIIAAIDDSLGNYIRGIFFVSLFVSVVSYILLRLLDVPYPLLLAIISGITNIIPYFGPIIGAIPAAAIAATVSGKTVVFVLLALFGLQIVESNLVSPFIMGKSIRIHPIAIIFVLLLGGEIGGVLGMIISVPILTVLKGVIPAVTEFR